MDTVIKVEKVSKRFILPRGKRSDRGAYSYNRLSDSLVSSFANLRRRFSGGRGDPEADAAGGDEFWALQDVSFEIKRGDVVGIIGRNGAGKSTLLKILSRITPMTSGQIELNGRVASLLEVGTGFHPELSGRENIFLNGAILGMTRSEIRSKFDEIVEFSEIGRFLDTPVKRYSSGMYVRLAFAVAAHLQPEILIVDEVLAVGDLEFQRKCLGKMRDVATSGRTVLFVSHNMAAVARLCDRGILLNGGKVEADGGVQDILARYLAGGNSEICRYPREPFTQRVGNDYASLISVEVEGADGARGPYFSSTSDIRIKIAYRVEQPHRGLRVGIHLHGPDGTILFNSTDCDRGEQGAPERPGKAGTMMSTCVIPAGLLNRSQYFVTVGSDSATGLNFYCENALSFYVERVGSPDGRAENRPGLICPPLAWTIEGGDLSL